MKRMFVSLLAAVGLLAGGALTGSAPAAAVPSPAAVDRVAVRHAFPKIDLKRDKPQAASKMSFTKGMAAPVPPSASPLALKRATCSPPCYEYAGRSFAGSGVVASSINASVITASLDQQDYHTLWEMAGQAKNASGTSGLCNYIELGTNRDRVVNGDVYPALTTHLFGSVWYCGNGPDGTANTADDVPTFCGYNGGCGYVDNAANAINLGSDITAANNIRKNFQILHDPVQHVWWLWYDTGYLGSFPDNLGHGQTFTSFSVVQTFDEMVTGHKPSCTDGGNSWLADNTKTFPQTGQENFSFNTDTGSGYSLTAYTGTTTTNALKWNVSTVSNFSYYSGGPGYSPNPGACP